MKVCSMNKKRPIGIFDSGMGGLTVVKEMRRILPNEDIVYFGDTARVPYGPKSQETIIRFSIENILFLLKHEVKMIVVACNTSSSVALPTLENHFKIPLLGVIEPGARKAVTMTKNERIGVIGTRTTISSRAYEKYIHKYDSKVKVFSQDCPLFVPLVEEGWFDSSITKDIAEYYLASLKQKNIDSLVLGCTHYPLLKNMIKKVMGKSVTLIDSAKQVAQYAKEILIKENLVGDNNKRGIINFYVSDEPDNFTKNGRKFLGDSLQGVRKVAHV